MLVIKWIKHSFNQLFLLLFLEKTWYKIAHEYTTSAQDGIKNSVKKKQLKE